MAPFDAGLLNGWSAAGNRPECTLVTAVRTAALTAPFAFVGRDSNAAWKRVFNDMRTKILDFYRCKRLAVK